MKYKYINSNISWIGSFPEHWKIERIKSRTENIVGGEWGLDPDIDDSDGARNINVIRVQDFNDINVHHNELTVRKVKNTKIPQRLVDNNCLLIEKSGGGEKQLVGRVVHPKGIIEESICSNFIAKMSFDLTIDVSFLNYVFHDLYNGNLNYPFVQQTTGIQNINIAYYLYTKFPFPPKFEQTIIAQYIEKACSDIDKVIAIKKKQISTIQHHLKSTIFNSITKGLNLNTQLQETGEVWLNKIPFHWKFDRLKDVVELRTDKTDEKSENIDYIELEDIEKETGRVLNFRNTLEVAGKVTLFYEGDVLFCKLRPYLVKHHLALSNGKCTGEILVYNCTKILNRYFQYCISSHGFIQKCTAISYGAKMPRVDPTKQLAYFVLPLPPRKEQVEICDFLDEIKTKTYDLTRKIEIQIETLQQYKKSLIHEVVTGKKQVYGLT